MSRRGETKWVCNECGAESWFRRHERIRAGHMRCTGCGSAWLQPTKASIGGDQVAQGNSAKAAFDEGVKRKMGEAP